MYVYKTHGTCSQAIEIEVEGTIIKRVKFIGGCTGNTQGVARLAEGMDWVLVGGVPAIAEGIWTGDAKGRVL